MSVDSGQGKGEYPLLSNALFGAVLNAGRASVGLAPVDNVYNYGFTDHPWLAADPTLALWLEPADLEVVQTGAWILPDERPLSAELVVFLDAGTPPVYVGFGSLRAPEGITRVAIEAIRAQGRRALISHGWADLALIDDRDDCFAVGEVNQQALFGRVAAVVHHGGAGTTTAARAGAPQVVVAQWADQPYRAARVADLGIGTAHDATTPTTESLSAAPRTVLTPETCAQAAAVASTIRTDGAAVAATLLFDAVSRESCQCPRDPPGIVELEKVPGAEVHRDVSPTIGIRERVGPAKRSLMGASHHVQRGHVNSCVLPTSSPSPPLTTSSRLWLCSRARSASPCA